MRYSVYNAPLPLTRRQSLDVKLILALLCSIFLLIPFCYIPASAAVFVVLQACGRQRPAVWGQASPALRRWNDSLVSQARHYKRSGMPYRSTSRRSAVMMACVVN